MNALAVRALVDDLSLIEHPPEDVHFYPAAPRIEVRQRHLVVMHSARIVAESRRPLRVIRAGHPPIWFFAGDEVDHTLLVPRVSVTPPVCELGEFACFDVRVERRRAPQAAWSITRPAPGFEALAGRFSFFPGRLDAALADGEVVIAQPGGALPGWITRELRGPFAA